MNEFKPYGPSEQEKERKSNASVKDFLFSLVVCQLFVAIPIFFLKDVVLIYFLNGVNICYNLFCIYLLLKHKL